jgi:hypothetical protein
MAARAFAFSPDTYARLRARRIAAALADACRDVCRALTICETDQETRAVRGAWSRLQLVHDRFENMGLEC